MMEQTKRTKEERAKEETKKVDETAQRVVEAIQVRILKSITPNGLLDMTMLNGKKLRDCTCGELERMGDLLSGFGNAGKPDEIIDPDKLVEYVQSREPSYKSSHILLHMAQCNALRHKLSGETLAAELADEQKRLTS
jgi:hypothetical protein